MGRLHKYKPPEHPRAPRYARPVNFAQLLFPDFSLILCGYLVCRFTALNRKVWEPLESLVYFFLFPVLLFHSIVKSPLDLGAASSLMAAGLVLLAPADRSVLLAAALALAGAPAGHPAARGQCPDRISLQLLHCTGAGRQDRRSTRAADDRGADRCLRAAVQRRRGLADGPPCQPRLCPRAGAQPADPRPPPRAWSPTCWVFPCRCGWSPRSTGSARLRWPWA
jgi:hypothetical protein